MKKKLNLIKKEVQKTPCKTCPFAGESPIKLSQERMDYLYKQLLEFRSQHLCHSSKNNSKICRGGREIQLRLLYVRGAIESPTDESFEKATKEALNIKD